MQIDLDFKLQNRSDAAIKFLDILTEDLHYLDESEWVLCALGLDALPLVNIIAKRLQLKYDILFHEEILAPNNQECTIATVTETEEIVIHKELADSFDIGLDYIYGQSHMRYEEDILKKIYRYRRGEKLVTMKDKNILFVDDSCENNLIALAGIKTAINAGAKKIAYMCAVIPKEIEIVFEKEIDELFYLYSAYNYIDNQHYYVEKLKKLEEDDILPILENSENFIANIEEEVTK